MVFFGHAVVRDVTAFQPSLRDWNDWHAVPASELAGYFQCVPAGLCFKSKRFSRTSADWSLLSDAQRFLGNLCFGIIGERDRWARARRLECREGWKVCRAAQRWEQVD